MHDMLTPEPSALQTVHQHSMFLLYAFTRCWPSRRFFARLRTVPSIAGVRGLAAPRFAESLSNAPQVLALISESAKGSPSALFSPVVHAAPFLQFPGQSLLGH
jgi:hypothetical protein